MKDPQSQSLTEELTHKLVFVTVELAKFDKQVASPANPLEEFVYMLKHLQDFDTLQQLPNFSVKSWMRGAFEELQMAKLSPDQRAMAEADIIWLRDKLTQDERNKRHYLKQGKKVGLKEGKAEGKKEGASEKAFEMARLMKQEGEPIEKIIRYTGLSEQQIAAL